jgi:hypothetical protein
MVDPSLSEICSLPPTRQPRTHWWILALVFLVLFGTGCSRGQVGHASEPKQSAETPPTKPAALAPRASVPLSCPAVNRLPIQPSQPGHHKVTLSWNASIPSPKHDKAFGYCLYRSMTKNPVKEKPPCKDCEQVNRSPFGETSCVDDIVQDGVTYYYVAMAVNAAGRPSDWSNQTPAPIPAGNQTSSVPAGSDTSKFCRGGPASK